MANDFKDKTIFITGAAKGQGRAVALAFAKEGAYIIAFDLGERIEYPAYNRSSNEDLEKLKSEVESEGGKILIYAGDVRKAADVEEAVERVGTVEGYFCCKAAYSLAKKMGVSMPITEQLNEVLFNGGDVRLALGALMNRPLNSEEI